jgi:hypothetical protein
VGRNPASFAKRQRELNRQRKRADKARKRAARRQAKPDSTESNPDGDPDLEGIVFGPNQPHFDEFGLEINPSGSSDTDE